VFSICEDKDGNLWIGTDDTGINKFDRPTNKFHRFQNDPDDPNSIGDQKVSQVFCDSYGEWNAQPMGLIN
jgi:streptogramin lyase